MTVSESKTVTAHEIFNKIIDKGYSLSAGQYFDIKIEYVALSEEEFNQRVAIYTKNLSDLFEDNKKLEMDIKQRLEELKYEA